MDSSRRLRCRFFDDLAAAESLEYDLAEAEQARERADAAVKQAQAEQRAAHVYAKDVQERLDALRTRTQRSRKALRTMATFPPELLGIIVAAGVTHRDPNAVLDIDWEAASLPYRASAVSRHWRQAILASAACWTYVGLPPVPVITPQNMAALTSHLDTMLARSCTQLLDVSVVVGWDTTEKMMDLYAMHAEDGLYARLFAPLMANSRRICSLSMRTKAISYRWRAKYEKKRKEGEHPGPVLEKMLGLLQCPTPELVQLSVWCEHASSMDEKDFWLGFPRNEFALFLPDAPKLEELYIAEAPVLLRRRHPVGLPALHTLTLHCDQGVYNSLLWDTLSCAPKLDQLILRTGGGITTATQGEHVVTSLPITHLELGQETYFNTRDTALPNLRSLEFPWLSLSNLHVTESMARTVTTLVIEPTDLDEHRIIDMRELRAVEHARLEGEETFGGDAALFAALCDVADPMWPNLRHLELFGVENGGHQRDGILRLVRERNIEKRTGKLLEKLEFDPKTVPGWVAAQVKDIMGEERVIVKMPVMYYVEQ